MFESIIFSKIIKLNILSQYKTYYHNYNMLNKEVFEHIRKHGKKILVVTKYWDKKKTHSILEELENMYPDILFWIWENRTDSLRIKEVSRENTHFIGNIQSRKIPEIIQYCSTIHSLESIKHAKKIENIWVSTQAFIQIKLDESKDIWIHEEEIWAFLNTCALYKHLDIIWISGMWALEISELKKREEFRKLIRIRDTYLPNGLISAGTSRDYIVAIEEWIDVVRVGSSAVN